MLWLENRFLLLGCVMQFSATEYNLIRPVVQSKPATHSYLKQPPYRNNKQGNQIMTSLHLVSNEKPVFFAGALLLVVAWQKTK
jgi:hypothetical protein